MRVIEGARCGAPFASVTMGHSLSASSPPFGLRHHAACIVGQVSPETGMRRIRVCLGRLGVGLPEIAFAPSASTCFP